VVNIIGKKWSTSPEQVVKMDRNIQIPTGSEETELGKPET
jgi:hypothetical protein